MAIIRTRAQNVQDGDTIVDRSNSRFNMFVEEASPVSNWADEPWIKLRNEGATTFYRATDIVYILR